jgi:hypothetical protein
LAIDKKYLSIDNIKHDVDTLFVISNEETNKTGAMVDFISFFITYKPLKKTKMIIMACNIATLRGIQGRLTEANVKLPLGISYLFSSVISPYHVKFIFASRSLP